ncbi:MAG: methylmalonyl-CoA epimerase [Pseudonocardiales bacterium]|nr:methylmalonyl-CoA epimerase [Pseudonocardiales bacterium]
MKGIHHAGIVVSDLDRAIDFYTGVLGLEMMSEPSPVSESAHLDRVLGITGARIRGLLLRAGDGAIELHEFSAPEWRGERPVPAHALGAQHVAFWVDDVVAEKAAIEARGGRFMTEVNVIDSGPFAGLRTAFIRDPDGIRIELVQVAYWPAAERQAGIEKYWMQRQEKVVTDG